MFAVSHCDDDPRGRCHKKEYDIIRAVFFFTSLVLLIIALVNLWFVGRMYWPKRKELNIRTRNHAVVSILCVIGML
jgi:hypothetical protein